jgi:MFS family permease
MSPAIHAIFDSACPDELEGEFVGFNQFFKHSGQAIGPILAGTIASLYGINASFLAAGFISFLIFLLTGYSLYES